MTYWSFSSCQKGPNCPLKRDFVKVSKVNFWKLWTSLSINLLFVRTCPPLCLIQHTVLSGRVFTSPANRFVAVPVQKDAQQLEIV